MTGLFPLPIASIALRLQSLLGLVVFLAICYGIGCLWARRRLPINWRVVGFGMALQFAFALLILKTWPGEFVFEKLDRLVQLLLAASKEGAAFMFGNMARGQNLPVGQGGPFAFTNTDSGMVAELGAYFAFNVLPTIIFFSALLTVLYHAGVMDKVVRGMAWVMRRSMKTTGPETLSAAANIFVGQTEAPLFVRPFLAVMTVSELFAVMTGGFSNIASGVLGVYAGMLEAIDGAGGHLLAASVISAPAGLVVAKLMLPEKVGVATDTSLDEATREATDKPDANILDAAVRGTRDGLILAANVGAILIVFTAGVWLMNELLGWLCDGLNDGLKRVGVEGDPVPILSIEGLLGIAFHPVAWLCGIPWEHGAEAGQLIGIKTTLNEFFGYLGMQQGLAEQGEAYLGGRRQQLILLYALCGFANFASVGIQIGGIGVLAPSRRKELAKIGLLAMVGGTIASLLTACVVGILV